MRFLLNKTSDAPTGSTDARSISRLAVRWRYESSDLTDLTPRAVPCSL